MAVLRSRSYLFLAPAPPLTLLWVKSLSVQEALLLSIANKAHLCKKCVFQKGINLQQKNHRDSSGGKDCLLPLMEIFWDRKREQRERCKDLMELLH